MYYRPFSTPTIIRNFFVRRAAKLHGRMNKYLAPDVVASWLKKIPEYSPDTNADHARNEAARILPSELPLWESQLREKEHELTKYPSRSLLWVGLLGLFVCEVFGDIQLLMLLNVDVARRTIMSIAFAAFIFFITWICSTGNGNTEKKKSRNFWWKVALAFYALLVIAIAVIQANSTPTTEESTRLSQLSAGIILLCTTAGPALVAHFILERLAPLERCAREIRLLRRQITSATLAKRKADEYIARIENWKAYWQNEAEQIVAVYRMKFVLAGGTPPSALQTPLGVTTHNPSPTTPSVTNHSAATVAVTQPSSGVTTPPNPYLKEAS
jgi:hypothetical protein